MNINNSNSSFDSSFDSITDSLILLNELIIEIINNKNYFNNDEYININKINKSCMIEDDDCNTTKNNKLNIQHYIFYFLLEFIKLNISENNNINSNNENTNNKS